MEYLVYIIVALIPATVALLLVHYFLKHNAERAVTDLSMQLKKERHQFFLEPRMEAYQRIVLLLERINPHSLVMRLHDGKLSAIQLQGILLSNIRQEFDHNVAQQIFISPAAWDLVKKSKEETIKIINIAAQQMNEEASANDLSNKILALVAEIVELPTDIAIRMLKQELQLLF